MTGLLTQRNLALGTLLATFIGAISLFATGKLKYVNSDFALIPAVQLTEMQRAIQTHVKLADKGDTNAMNSLGIMYLRGELGLKDGKINIDTAVSYFQKAADKGHSAAQNSLGSLYFNGVIGKDSDGNPDYEAAKRYFELAANQDNVEAMHGLATLYRSGSLDSNQAPDYEKTIALYQKMIDAKEPRGYVNLATMYLNGESFEQNPNKAIQLLEEARALKSSLAMRLLGQVYATKELNPSKKVELNKTVALYKEAIDLDDSEAMVMLGSLYVNGEYGKKDDKADYAAALELYQNAAKRNNPVAFTNIGNMFYNGMLVDKNNSALTIAKQYWERAAQLGDSAAIENLKKITTEPENAINKTNQTESDSNTNSKK